MMLPLKGLQTMRRLLIRPYSSSVTQSSNLSALKKSLEARNQLDLLKKIESNENIDPRFLPNLIHPDVLTYGETPKEVSVHNEIPKFPKKPANFGDICHKLNLLKMDVGEFAGSRSYYLMHDLAALERSLILYAVERLRREKFELVAVPDILPARNIEACGMQVHGLRNQVYKLSDKTDGSEMCLSGTSEMALATFLSGKIFKKSDLPRKFMAVSRCFRAETSKITEERGIYRVHQFNKVEMFGVTAPEDSEIALEKFKSIQIELFNDLGLNFKVLDMPPHELGAPAYRKYDIESWMPGREMYGELSSCSNCTDYQSSRLNIRMEGGEFAHTINGTAAAIPRLLIAIIESFQDKKGIEIPKVLRKYMKKSRIERDKVVPATKLIKDVTREMYAEM
ncbi:serine--tRNA ligase, mitochondrial [Culicoides brevitarsis]|uniref:serine--tRNA ligase, mitochondrial n=1 Tax=Culicoides brevitarsis TaxID=469753 RepID=UPI00307BA344